MDELPGQIGPYQVRDRLGHGGMGVVYLAYDPMLDRSVAIKVLKVPDEETRRRFLREARLAAKVHHPHIVSIYAVGEHEGNPYLAMEFIAGRTLSQIIRSGEAIPLARKVHWLSELCAGLGHAHDSGIVHRDVKPSNLLIAQNSGTLRLLDFGIAHGNEASGMTMAGMIVGTPQYMSPEQITGQAVDARSDIFSVGTVAYELLTGRQAFGGDNLYHVSRQIVGEQPRPIETFVPDVPHALVKTIGRCLQKDPATRADNARTLEREFLAIARRLDPEHTLIVLPAEPTVVAPAKDVTTSRRELMREAEEAIAQGQLTTASGLLQKLESGTSPSPDVQMLRQKLQGRRLELRVHEAVSKADDALQTGSIEDAEAAIGALADISPRHDALERLRGALQQRIDDRQVAALTSRARQALQQDRFEEAEVLIAEALALAPDAADALAVQQKIVDRARAQRIARLVAQASRALEQDDAGGARKAIDALLKLDPAHRDVTRLQSRLQALLEEKDTGAMKAQAPALPAPLASPGPAARPAAPTAPPPAPRGRTSGTAPAADALLRHPAPDPQTATRPAPVPDHPAPARTTGLPIAIGLLLVLLVAGGGYWFVAMRKTPATPAVVTSPAAQVASPAPATPAPPVVAPTAATTPAENGAPAAAATPAAVPASATPTPAAPRDPWAPSRQFAAAGRYDRALAAIDQMQGMPAALMQEERNRVVENARRQALAARRGAEDLRLTRTQRYQQGVARQDDADGHRTAGRLKSAVAGYMDARALYLQAFTDSGKAAPPVVTAPVAPEPAPAATPPPAPPPAAAAAGPDLSTWSNDEARATISQFCGAYLGRDMGGLNRLYPNMGPEWRTEFREAFGTTGELVCVFENVTIVRASDEFSVSARLLTQLPGGDQRRRSLVLSLVPARDRLVIGTIRVR
ncbi:protein kinase [Luteitalea sp.]|uniref:serine/threonine-protein kinase n=1 Tax=Luteitalea sp. TaxID=2004800 RepID=UPI0037C9F9D3